MKLLVISLILLCTAWTSIPTPKQNPELAWFAMGFGCPAKVDIMKEFKKRNIYGYVSCFPASTTDDPAFYGNDNDSDYFQFKPAKGYEE